LTKWLEKSNTFGCFSLWSNLSNSYTIITEIYDGSSKNQNVSSFSERTDTLLRNFLIMLVKYWLFSTKRQISKKN